MKPCRAKERGVNVWVETLIQYLLLDRTDAEKPNFEGAKSVMSPPLRDKSNQEVLWNGLRRVDPDGRDRSCAFDFDDPESQWVAKISRRFQMGFRRWKIG